MAAFVRDPKAKTYKFAKSRSNATTVTKRNTSRSHGKGRHRQLQIGRKSRSQQKQDHSMATSDLALTRLSPQFAQGRTGELIGIKNLGNTCYLAAIVRSLMSLKCLNADLRRKWLCRLRSESMRGVRCIFRCILELLLKDRDEEKVVLDPWILKQVLGDKNSMFASNRQQDAHELLSFVLNSFHGEVFKAVLEIYPQGEDEMTEALRDELKLLSPIHNNYD